jgi:hypothetical protein
MSLIKKEDVTEDQINEFYKFLQGELPDTITLPEPLQFKLTEEQAFAVIWYLQEHLTVLPSQFEKCTKCHTIFNSYAEGESTDEGNYCDHCR